MNADSGPRASQRPNRDVRSLTDDLLRGSSALHGRCRRWVDAATCRMEAERIVARAYRATTTVRRAVRGDRRECVLDGLEREVLMDLELLVNMRRRAWREPLDAEQQRLLDDAVGAVRALRAVRRGGVELKPGALHAR